MSGFAVGVTLPTVTLPSGRHWRFVPAEGPRFGYEVATPELRAAREIAAYREATGREPRNLLPGDPGFEQWAYRRPRTLADRAELVMALTELVREERR